MASCTQAASHVALQHVAERPHTMVTHESQLLTSGPPTSQGPCAQAPAAPAEPPLPPRPPPPAPPVPPEKDDSRFPSAAWQIPSEVGGCITHQVPAAQSELLQQYRVQ